MSEQRDGMPRLLVLACGALASEIRHIVRINGLSHITLMCLPARFHNTPERIVPELETRLERLAPMYERILIGYADCGTGGRLDSLVDRWENVERLPGAHCYEFFATSPRFMELHEAELGTFYLTDFLTRHFDRLVWDTLGLSRHPQLRDMYFGNYRKLVYLSQFDDPELYEMAEEAADRLGLEFHHHPVGLGDLGTSLERFAAAG
ncbi:MAG: DUF1638 domain-containing protein [bacterium]|nr:DUF1638 domain-containing protein [bacterium]MDE0288670.1 DUF1638 domain-containing protein [bacterium]MDE0439602.1 DUF1638 domain-containing protein [bacterium]